MTCKHPSFGYQRRQNGVWVAADKATATIKRCLSCNDQLAWGPANNYCHDHETQFAVDLVAAEILAGVGGPMTDLNHRGYRDYWNAELGRDRKVADFEMTLTWEVGYLVAAIGHDARRDIDHMTNDWEAVKAFGDCGTCGTPIGGLCNTAGAEHHPERISRAFSNLMAFYAAEMLLLRRDRSRLATLADAAEALMNDGAVHSCPSCNHLARNLQNALTAARRPFSPDDLPIALRDVARANAD